MAAGFVGRAALVAKEGMSKSIAFVGRAAVEAAFGELFRAVKESQDTVSEFRAQFNQLSSTLARIRPIIDDIERSNKVLDRAWEMDRIQDMLTQGVKLVKTSAKVGKVNIVKKHRYTKKLEELNKSIEEFFRVDAQAVILRDVKEILVNMQVSDQEVKTSTNTLEEGGGEGGAGLDKNFGFSKNFGGKYEIGEEVGRGRAGYTCCATSKKGDMKGQEVAVKVIPKAKMTTVIAIEDVRREVKILRALTGHDNLVQFYDAYEDNDNVYIVMELCEGGELLDRILSRGGKYTEDDARAVLIQILNVVAFCHLQGVVHRDLKPENFLFSSKDENSSLKAIDFGLSDYVKPDERLNDIVGSADYVAPEVLHGAYTSEADVWSIGVISYILLCGSRPFWARTESGIFRAVLKADPSFDEQPWPSLSAEAKDFVKRLLIKDPRKRMTAVQALSHPWIRNFKEVKVPLDILVFKLMKAYMRSSTLRRAALRALSKTLTVDELFYMKEQFALLEPNNNGTISLDNIKAALMKSATDAMKDSRVPDFLTSLSALQYRRMDFEEFCAATLSVHQLEALDRWEQHARCAYEIFEKEGNRAIVIDELASELGVSSSVPVYAVLHDWIRHTDGNLSFHGFLKLLHGVWSRTIAKT